jgi:hypothetical protein
MINNPLVSPLPFHGSSNKLDMKSLSSKTYAQLRKEKFSEKLSPRENAQGPDNPPIQQQISHLERLLTGLKTYLFNKKSLVIIQKNPLQCFIYR